MSHHQFRIGPPVWFKPWCRRMGGGVESRRIRHHRFFCSMQTTKNHRNLFVKFVAGAFPFPNSDLLGCTSIGLLTVNAKLTNDIGGG